MAGTKVGDNSFTGDPGFGFNASRSSSVYGLSSSVQPLSYTSQFLIRY